jgi:hypothetical protein
MKYKQNPCVFAADLEAETCLFHSMKKRYYDLNLTATFIWKLLHISLSLDQIVDALVEHFFVDEEVCREKTLLFVSVCLELDVICIAKD